MAEKIELQKYLVSQGWYFNPNYKRENYKYRKILFDDDKNIPVKLFSILMMKGISVPVYLFYMNNKKKELK